MSDLENRPAAAASPTPPIASQPATSSTPGAAPAPAPGGSATPSDSTGFGSVETPDEPAEPVAQDELPPESSSAPSSDQQAASELPPTSESAPAAPTPVSLRLRLIDFASMPIAGMVVRLEINGVGRSVITDALGNCPVQSDLIPGSSLEVFVQKENGQWASKYAVTIASGDMDILGVSPSIKIPITTEQHTGIAPAPKPPATPKSPPAPKPAQPNAPPKDTPKSGGETPSCVTTEPKRNSEGHPLARVREVLVDWAGRAGIPTLGLWSWDDFKRGTGPTTPLACTPAPSPPAPAAASPAAASAAQATGTTASAPAKAPPAAPELPQPRTAAFSPANVSVTSFNQAPPSELTHMLELMEEQILWDWKKPPLTKTSEDIVAALITRSLGEPVAKPAAKSAGACYKSVKVGLKRANYVAAMNGDIPAMTAGAWLKDQHFKEVTKDLPDARWAWPGDVIVYKYPASKEAANDAQSQAELDKKLIQYEKDNAAYLEKKKTYDLQKEEFEESKALWLKDNPKKTYPKKFTTKAPTAPKKPAFETQNYGHIDVRSYDSYLSDFRPGSNSLPDAMRFEVIGIYRKISDPLPDIRVKAFLKILREWECHEEGDDSKRYFLLNSPINGIRQFSDCSKHPFLDIKSDNTAAGAYQIKLATFKYNTGPDSGIPPSFTPRNQDRIATRILEGRQALGPIRRGDLTEAVRLLANEWSSLPSGKQPRREKSGNSSRVLTIDDLIARHKEFMGEIIK